MEGIVNALNYFLDNYVVAAAVLLVAFAWAVYRIATAVQKMRYEAEKVKDLPCGEHRAGLDQTLRASLELEASVRELRAEVAKMKDLPCGEHRAGLDQTIKMGHETATMVRELRAEFSNLKNLPCAEHRAGLDRNATAIQETGSILGKMSGQLEMLIRLAVGGKTSLTPGADIDFSARHSPRQLNDNGLKLFADIKGEEFLAANGEEFIRQIDMWTPKTPLDVEFMAYAVLRAAYDQDIFNDIKRWIYYQPPREIVREDGSRAVVEITFDKVVSVLALPLRDMYLSLHPELL